MLMEYTGGRAARGPEQIELFFCSEKPKVPLFTRVLTAVAKEQGLPADVREEAKQGCLDHHLLGIDRQRAARLPSAWLRLDRSGLVRAAWREGERPARARRFERRRALAYVAGAWARHRVDRTMVLVAGTSKADRLASLLKALGCRDVRVESRLEAARDRTPSTSNRRRKSASG